MIRLSLASIASAASLSLAACGGGSVLDVFLPPAQTVHLSSADADSGFAWSNGAPTVHTSDTLPFILGDNLGNHYAHAFIRFPRALVPAGATIESARLVMYQYAQIGTPYLTLGPSIQVDQVNMGASFDHADMTAPNVIQLLGPLSISDAVETKEMDVTTAVQNAVDNGLSHVDFRLRFDSASDGLGNIDVTALNNESDIAGSGVRPTLVVTYR